jgi:hypothetical protein
VPRPYEFFWRLKDLLDRFSDIHWRARHAIQGKARGLTMEQALLRIQLWAGEGRPAAWLWAAVLVAVCFVLFNAMRTLLYVPQLLTCLRDPRGCRAINLWTWGSWVVANGATALYLWMFLDDRWGALLNLANATMCLAIVLVAMVQRQAGVARPVRGQALPEADASRLILVRAYPTST